MKESRPILIQGAWLLTAAALFTGAGLLQPGLNRMSQEAGLAGPSGEADPKTMLLTLAPGGFRAPILAFLWIRADQLKNDGKYYDAMQLAQFICHLEPHFAGAWAWQAFNMSFNISVGTHTLDQRWHWVYGGIKLLRDEGIPLNPQSVALYQELSWTFFNKVGGFMDDFHEEYKARWASYMQHLLAPPPWGSAQEMLDAFRPITEAPLDLDPQRQGKELIQKDKLAEVLCDPQVAQYAALLEVQGVSVGQPLLDAYNRDSNDECIRAVRPFARPRSLTQEPTQRDLAIRDLINSAPLAPAREKLLAFVRAQLLWNQYKMDPRWMLGLMEKYGPLDWRLPWSHSIYWSTYGFHAAQGTPLDNLERLEALNNSRDALFGLQDFTRQGRVTYVEDPNNPDLPSIFRFPDWRFVEPTQQEYIRLIQRSMAERHDAPEDNPYRAGHINYLASAVQMLFILYRHKEAQEYLDYLKDFYKLRGGEWDKDLEGFVIERFNSDKDVGRDTAQTQISSAIQTSYLLRLQNDNSGAAAMARFALRIHGLYNEKAAERNILPAFQVIEAGTLSWLIAQPRVEGYNLSLQTRSSLYNLADDTIRRIIYYGLQEENVRDLVIKSGMPEKRARTFVYPNIVYQLRLQCAQENPPLDFNRAFPAPPK